MGVASILQSLYNKFQNKELGTAFFLPIIRPPRENLSNVVAYYGYFDTEGVKITAASPSPGNPIEILIENADVIHPTSDADVVSTVFAVTSGFVSYETGDIVIRVWLRDFRGLAKTEDGAPRANRIVLGSIDPTSIETAIGKQIELLSDKVLEESWKQSNSGTVPEDRTTLETDFRERFMAGDARLFVPAGAALGTAAIISTNPTVARLTVMSFFDATGPAPPIPVAPEDLIDNALKPVQLLKFAGHPLLKALSGPITIRFLSQFVIWDNTPGVLDYIPLANTKVTLLAGPDVSKLPDFGVTTDVEAAFTTTDANGFIDLFAPPLPARSLIHFRYDTTGKTFGLRTFTEDVETNSHKARQYVNGLFENRKLYRSKYELFPKYKDFANDLAENKNERYEGDRGNMALYEKYMEPVFNFLEPNILPAITHRDLMKHFKQFERSYKADVLAQKNKTLNILVEGDSWLNYPFAFNDIYGHLDQIIWARKKSDVTYNRIPLQHYGDRSDQMFFAVSPTASRQWRHTLDILFEYKIDLIFASGGGNDVAEPGIGNATSKQPWLTNNFSDGYFDPGLAKNVLDPTSMSIAEKLMKESFAVLLQNHRWYSYFNGTPLKDEPTMTAMLDPLLSALHKDFGESDRILQPKQLQDIGNKVIANFPSLILAGSAEEQLINAIFDPITLNQRLIDIKNNWVILLNEAQQRNIPVLTHTYGYPLFNEEATSPFGEEELKLAGTWFINRFWEANIHDRRIQKICLKMILDKFVTDVLTPLKALYPNFFDYVDIRNLNSSVDTWRDEMHLRGSGYRKIAEKVYDAIVANPKLAGFFS